MTELAGTLLVARRELRLQARGRATLGAFLLLAAVAWLPAILLPLRGGRLGLASFGEMLALELALAAVVLPLVALLAGAELLAGEIEDESLVPVLTLPISRRACYAGKCLGRATALVAAYTLAFAGVAIAVVAARGGDGWLDWLALAGAGLLALLASGGVGVALGAGGQGRVRALGGALLTWLLLVFVLDALLLSAVVALAPPPPGAVGEHGHGELAAPGALPPAEDPHARQADLEPPPASELSTTLMASSPVSLFRLTTLAASPVLRPRLELAAPRGTPATRSAILTAGWIFWLLAPPLVGLRRFSRADL